MVQVLLMPFSSYECLDLSLMLVDLRLIWCWPRGWAGRFKDPIAAYMNTHFLTICVVCVEAACYRPGSSLAYFETPPLAVAPPHNLTPSESHHGNDVK